MTMSRWDAEAILSEERAQARNTIPGVRTLNEYLNYKQKLASAMEDRRTVAELYRVDLPTEVHMLTAEEILNPYLAKP